MKDKNNIEFDELFRQQLGNASAPVPGGVWEGISSSIGSGAGVATAAVKTALWIKAAIAVSVIGVVAAVSYQLIGNKESSQVQNPGIIQPAELPDTKDTRTTEKNITETQENVPAVTGSAEAIRPGKELVRGKRIQNTPSGQKVEFRLPKSKEPLIYEINPEISLNYLSKMNEQAVPGFDSSKIEKRDSEVSEDEPYIPEKEPVALIVDSSYIYIPNVVTPNGDGINDGYVIDIKGEESVQIIIYTAKSIKVFETKNKNIAWNCTLPNGEPAPEGTYIVRVIYKFKNKAKTTTTTNLRLIK